MKVPLTILVLTTSVLGGAQKSASPEQQPETWIEAVQYKPSEGLLEPDPSVGAPGADSVGFWLGPYQAGMIVTRIERRGIGVFVSITSEKPARGEVRLEFTDDSGHRHLMMPDASGGGFCLSFLSPPGMQTSSITNLRLLYDATASWAK